MKRKKQNKRSTLRAALILITGVITVVAFVTGMLVGLGSENPVAGLAMGAGYALCPLGMFLALFVSRIV